MALLEAYSEIAWLMSLQREISYLPTASTPLVSDNQGEIFVDQVLYLRSPSVCSYLSTPRIGLPTCI
jgi:hypothetical protein